MYSCMCHCYNYKYMLQYTKDNRKEEGVREGRQMALLHTVSSAASKMPHVSSAGSAGCAEKRAHGYNCSFPRGIFFLCTPLYAERSFSTAHFRRFFITTIQEV